MTLSKKINTSITRDIALSALIQLIQISDQLAADSMLMLNTGHYSWSTAAKILIGLDVRKNLLAVKCLAQSDLDDQIFIIFRTIVENLISIVYLSKKTMRGKRQLTPTQKAFLFITFPEFNKGLSDPSFHTSGDFRKIALRRKILVKNCNLYWHGTHLKAVCEELDRTFKKGKSLYLYIYREIYGPLSGITHPDAKKIHYIVDSTTGEIKFRPFFHSDGAIFFATLYASRVIRRWAVAIRTKRTTQIDLFWKNWEPLLKKR